MNLHVTAQRRIVNALHMPKSAIVPGDFTATTLNAGSRKRMNVAIGTNINRQHSAIGREINDYTLLAANQGSSPVSTRRIAISRAGGYPKRINRHATGQNGGRIPIAAADRAVINSKSRPEKGNKPSYIVLGKRFQREQKKKDKKNYPRIKAYFELLNTGVATHYLPMARLNSLITARTPAMPTTKAIAKGATAVRTVTKSAEAAVAAAVIAAGIVYLFV